MALLGIFNHISLYICFLEPIGVLYTRWLQKIKFQKNDEGKNYTMREIGYGTYERQIPLPDNTDINNAESSFKKGMLWINVPKKPTDKSKVRELEIKKQ